MTTVDTINPADGTPLASYPAMSTAQVAAARDAAAAAARAWGRAPVADRVDALTRLAAHLRGERERYAVLISREMGKPLAEARAEIEKSAGTADYYAAHAPALLADRSVDIPASERVRAWVAHEPLGLVLAVMPWNFPVWQVLRGALPILAAGNGILLKHAPNVTGSALAIAEAFARAGFPSHLVTTLVIAEPDVPTTVERLIADPRIAAVTFTGSNRTGEAIGAAAGRAAKPSVLELGGSDPFVVLADADVPAAAAAGVRARYTNSGQSCVCAKRFIIAEQIAEQFIHLFTAGVRNLVVGDPLHPDTTVGPLARADLRDTLQRQVDESTAAGATLLTGGRNQPGPGYFYEPTVLTNTTPGMPVFDEETFGPVAAISVAHDEAHAVDLANATPYGLGLSVWSTNPDRAVTVARQITSGAAFINATVASDPRVPFGGTKRSGHGRELAEPGALTFTNTRTYWLTT